MANTGLQAAIVADDLTGAMDAAAPFARRGLDVRVLTAPDALKMLLPDLPQILSINTCTRHVATETAAAVVAAVVGDLARLKPELLVKKIDSTLRGHVVVETVATMQAAGCREVRVCPAVPSQGRTLSGGELFIDGVPLRETAIGRDLRSPPPVAPLPELFRTAVPDIPVTLEVAGGQQAAGEPDALPRIRIVDAVSSDQLLTIAGSAVESRGDTLFVGAAGLTEALAETLFGPEVPTAVPEALDGITLFVVGSRAPQTIAQVEALKATNPLARIANLTATRPLDDQTLQRLAAPGQKSACLVLRPPQASTQSGHDSDLMAKALADSTAGLLARAKIGLLLATGGDTALAVLDALEVGIIRVCGEIQPGVVHGLIDTGRGPLRLVTKAGGFGDRQLFCTIEDYFQ